MRHIQICGFVFLFGSALLSGAAQAALQAPLDNAPAALLDGQPASGGEEKEKKSGSDCGQKPKLEAEKADAAEVAAKDRAVNGLVQLGHLPADKIEVPLDKPAQLAPKTMQTCK